MPNRTDARPMLIAIIEHDTDHPKTDPTNPPFVVNWLAFNSKTRKVMVEVEAADNAGLKAFKDHYGIGKANARGEVRDTHALPDNPADWISLQGESEAGDDPNDSMKHVRRATRMREALGRETDERERRRRERDEARAHPDASALPVQDATKRVT
jgi:hypothetical protein